MHFLDFIHFPNYHSSHFVDSDKNIEINLE